MAQAVGRPTKYTQEMVKLAEAYLKSCKDSYRYVGGRESKSTHSVTVDEVETSRSNTSTNREKLLFVKLPSIEGLALHLHIRRSTVYEWVKDNPVFSDIVEDILTAQAERLINGGVSGRYNHSVSKLILTKHGYVDRAEVKEVEDWDDLMSKAEKVDADPDATTSSNTH